MITTGKIRKLVDPVYNVCMTFFSVDEADTQPVRNMQALDDTMQFFDPFMMMGGNLGLLGIGGTDFSS